MVHDSKALNVWDRILEVQEILDGLYKETKATMFLGETVGCR